MKLSQVYAKHLGARISPKKVAPVAELIRGKSVLDAKIVLTFDPTKASNLLLKVLKSAEANALHNNKMTNSLYVSEVWVGPGPTMKRGHIVAKSRFRPILKRTSNIYIGLTENTYDKADKKVSKKENTTKSPVKKLVKKVISKRKESTK
jgi:large subunit ribosomal protein L22